MAPAAPNGQRIAHLDGLRGVAALVVLCNHLVITLVPSIMSFDPKNVRTSWDIPLGISPLAVFWSGKFAVCVFFALSGYVLADFSLRTRLSFTAQVARRYLRLALPMLAVSILSWLLLRLGLFGKSMAAAQLTHSGWLVGWYRFEPDFLAMVRETLYGVFLTGRADYNPNLWTMKVELVGSVGIFLLYALVGNRMMRLLLLVSLLLLRNNGYYLLFAGGAMLLEFSGVLGGVLSRWIPRPAWREWLLGAVFLFGLYLGSYPQTWSRVPFSWHLWMSAISGSAARWHMTGALLVLAAVNGSRFLQRVFGGTAGVFLGKISFMLYLVHIPVICSLTTRLVLALGGQPYPVVVIGAGAATIAVVLAVSVVLTRWVERHATELSREAGRAIDGWFPAGSGS